MQKSKVVNNTIMLYIMSIVKMIFPLLTLPYLTRVLSEETYGFVSYVRSCMVYMQFIVDFGFILSSVKDIVEAKGNKKEIGYIVGNTFLAKIVLSIVSIIILFIMCTFIEILKYDLVYVILSFLAVVTTVFMADFLFRGIEKMQYITYIYLVSKGITTVLTFLVVKDDRFVLWIPVLDIISNVISIIISFKVIRKLQIKIRIGKIADCIGMIKNSFSYFLSNIATTAFSALNTLLIGIYITDLTQVAYWSLCLNIILAIQGLYAPICNSIYPHMIKVKSISFIHKVLMIFMPVVAIGCVICYYCADVALIVVGGEKYIAASDLFRWLIPVLLFSFPAQLYGWPVLGAIGKVKETTLSTISAAMVQLVGLGVLIYSNNFNLITLAILRVITEFILMMVRVLIAYKNIDEFVERKDI